MKKLLKVSILAYLIALPSLTFAAYEADSDTGAGILDFIENRRRNERENRLTEEQIQLYNESNFIKNNLRRERTPDSPVPTIFEGDELTYNQVTGEFTAKGAVKIVTADYQKMTGDSKKTDDGDATISGNLNDEEVSFPGNSRLLELNENGRHIILDGYNTFYRYGARTGTMESAKGKVGHQYVSGKRFEFYPDRIIIYDGTTTKCNAEKPDYHIAADKITIYPNDKMVMEKAKIYVKGKLMYTRDRQIQSLDPNQEPEEWPSVGYSTGNGAWISYNAHRDLMPNVFIWGRLYYSTKHNFRNRAELVHRHADSEYKIAYGYYSDGDDNWIMRSPSFLYTHEKRIAQTPFHYKLEGEIGKWKRRQKYASDIESTHRFARIGIYRDPLHLGSKWYARGGFGWQATKETYDDSLRKGFDWNLWLLKEFDDKYAWYAGYEYSVVNKANSLFNYKTSDMARSVKTGVSYRMDNRNRFIIGLQYDEAKRSLKDVDYYWFHDMHCSQFIVRYRAKRASWQFRLEFTPW